MPLQLRAPCTLPEPVCAPSGPLKILLPLEPGPFSRQGGLLGAPEIVLPLEPKPLFRFQAGQEVPRGPQEAPKRPPRDPRSSPRDPKGRQEAAKMTYDAPKKLSINLKSHSRGT